MCTVTFIPGKDHITITSNRDEKMARRKAIAPVIHQPGNYKMIFPQDAAAGGSWIGFKENADAAVLLNGGFLPHIPKPPYAKSRGLIFLDMLAADNALLYLLKTDLERIEPFTIILFENKYLYEFRWDGTGKYCRELPADKSFIWSSSTLYTAAVIQKREAWFHAFMNRHPEPAQQEILHFHRFTGDGDLNNDLLMNRDGVYATVSITSIQLSAERGSIKYFDLPGDSMTEKKMEFISSLQTV